MTAVIVEVLEAKFGRPDWFGSKVVHLGDRFPRLRQRMSLPEGDIVIDLLLTPSDAKNPWVKRREPVTAKCGIASCRVNSCVMDNKEPLVMLWMPLEKDAVVAMRDKHVAIFCLLYM